MTATLGCVVGAPSEPPSGEVSQGLTSAPVCVSIRRQGSSGSVSDAQINNVSPPKSYGASLNMNAGVISGAERQMLLQFDLSAIPAGPATNVTSATMSLWKGLAASGPATLEVHRATAPWAETTVTWQSFAGAFDGAVWATFSNAPSVLTFDVQGLVTGWVRGTFANQGLVVLDPARVYSTNVWASEYTTVAQRPLLDVCYTVTCGAGQADCNGSGLDGCETDTSSSTAHCGGCNRACSFPHAGASCVSGACRIGACGPGFGDCNGNAADGCETDLGASLSHCGACGRACALPHATAACTAGACRVGACDPGFGDCNGNAADGCETALDTAAACGACGVACAAPAVCLAGACQNPSCAPGTYDCDGDPANGCEPLPCADGSRCADGAGCVSGTCTAGVCVPPPAPPPTSAADASGAGPLPTTSAEYRLPAQVNTTVIGDRVTEIWARLYRPADLSGGPFPLVIFLHGNHATCGNTATPRADSECSYTTQGACTNAGYPVVVQNHLGYGHIADRLASWGYLVVSINANRGINCGAGVSGDIGLNLARGRLILEHLSLLSGWSAHAGTTPASLGVDLGGKIDLAQVGLAGHSRGGEAVRAAYTQYQDAGSLWPARIGAPVTFRGIFEIGGNDGQTARVLDALGTAWHALLPACDNDNYVLEGVRPFDRMLRSTTDGPLPTAKSYTLIRGANHRFYNTEWQISEASGCVGPNNTPIFSTSATGSPAEQQNLRQLGMAFFRAYLTSPVPGATDPTFALTFDPSHPLDPALTAITQIDRSWIDSPARSVELDDMNRGLDSSAGVGASCTTIFGHDPGLRAAAIDWSTPSAGAWFQSDFAASGLDLGHDETLDFRVSRQVSATVPVEVPTDFSVRLVHADGSLSGAVRLSSYLSLDAPPGGLRAMHPHLRTVRIPLADFPAAVLGAVRGVRFVFDQTQTGAIYLADVRRLPGSSPTLVAAQRTTGGPTPIALGAQAPAPLVRTATATSRLSRRATAASRGEVEIELVSADPFPVDDALPVLRIGDVEVLLAAYPDDGDTHRMIFTLGPAELRRLRGGEPMHLQYGQAAVPAVRWDAGRFEPADAPHR